MVATCIWRFEDRNQNQSELAALDFLGLGYFTPCNLFEVQSLPAKFMLSLLFSWIVFHCVRVQHFHYPFICCRTFPGYCEQGNCKYCWANICGVVCESFGHVSKSGIAGSYSFLGFSVLVSIVVAQMFIPTNEWGFFSPTEPCQQLLTVVLLILAVLTGVRWKQLWLLTSNRGLISTIHKEWKKQNHGKVCEKVMW